MDKSRILALQTHKSMAKMQSSRPLSRSRQLRRCELRNGVAAGARIVRQRQIEMSATTINIVDRSWFAGALVYVAPLQEAGAVRAPLSTGRAGSEAPKTSPFPPLTCWPPWALVLLST